MSHILHLGHQATDISGAGGYLSTTSGGFDPGLDINALRFIGRRNTSIPIRLMHPPPAGDLWLGFRYVPPQFDAQFISESTASFLEFYDADNRLVAQIRPINTTSRYHAVAHGDTVEQGTSSYFAASGQPQWVDVRLAVGAEITITFYVDGIQHSTATALNTGSKGKPAYLIFGNYGLHNSSNDRIWYYAHIAILDGVPTIGRRFIRRVPNTLGTYNEMTGGLGALSDGDLASRVTSDLAGQRISFSLTGPTGPAAVTAVSGVHLKQTAQAGTTGPQATAGFLRIGGVNYDTPGITVPVLAPQTVYASWPLNPVDNTAWTTAALPTEVGILSA